MIAKYEPTLPVTGAPLSSLMPDDNFSILPPYSLLMKSRTIQAFRVLSVLYALAVSTVSSWPGIKLPDIGIHWTDKVAHFSQYAVFAFLVAGGWARSGGWRNWRDQWRPVLFLIVFAALDELHQIWIPRREASFLDWTADSLGILAGFAVGLLIFRRATK